MRCALSFGGRLYRQADKKGYRIAICEQVEDPKLAKGIVERKVIKIITPGTALNEQLLEDKHNRYLVFLQQAQAKGMCLAAADVTTGECEWFLDQTSESFLNITEQLYRLQPAELVVHFTSDEMSEKLQEWLAARLPECVVTHYDESTPEADYLRSTLPVVRCRMRYIVRLSFCCAICTER